MRGAGIWQILENQPHILMDYLPSPLLLWLYWKWITGKWLGLRVASAPCLHSIPSSVGNVPLPAVPAPDALRCLSAEVPRFTWCPGDHTHRDLEVPARTQLSFHVSSPCGILSSSLQALGSCRDTFLQALSWLWRCLGSLIQPHMPCAFNTVYELLSADKD